MCGLTLTELGLMGLRRLGVSTVVNPLVGKQVMELHT
ncbi:unnamed protein product [Linum tenue]|uniref:Uncharacterized protein n=1 Tax=Linum tenue TaxID=586396 RepID=A0AAV0NP08_9ROSI|nr:unnamed protein product [Linum tenue]